jgi:cell division transport system permease protein
VAAVIRHSLAEGWLLLRSRGLVSPILAVALAIPISLAGVTVSARQWLAPVIDLGDRESVVTVLLHPRLDAAARRAWINGQAARHASWRLREIGPEELADRLSRWFPYLEELLSREGPEMLPPMVEVTTADPTSVVGLRDDAAVLAVGPTSSVNRMVGLVARRFATVLLAVAAALMAGALLFAGVWVHLELHRNAEEIAIMRLMGATESTVRGPFLVAVTAPALIAAVTSVVLTVVTVGWMARLAAPLGLTAGGPPWWVLVAEAVAAVVLPITAAHVTLERHASVTES